MKKYVRTRIEDPTESAKVFAALVRLGRLDCYREGIYVVHELDLATLNGLGWSVPELGREGWLPEEDDFERLRRWVFHLPFKFENGQQVPNALLHEAKEDLLARFLRVQASPGVPWQGHEEVMVRLLVDVDDTAANWSFFSSFKAKLIERFQEIYLVTIDPMR